MITDYTRAGTNVIFRNWNRGSDEDVAQAKRLLARESVYGVEYLGSDPADPGKEGRLVLEGFPGYTFPPSFFVDAPVVAVIMGSDSDWNIMEAAEIALKEFGVPVHAEVVSAHRTAKLLYEWCEAAVKRRIKMLIAGAGGSAHLPGMAAAISHLPTIGVPVWQVGKDATQMTAAHSIFQMPPDVPVLMVGINSARNAGLAAVEMLALSDERLAAKLKTHREKLAQSVYAKTVGNYQRLPR